MRTIVILLFIVALITSCNKPIIVGKTMLTPGNGYKIYDTAKHRASIMTKQ